MAGDSLIGKLVAASNHYGAPLVGTSAAVLAVISTILYTLAVKFQLGPYRKYRGLPPGPPSSLLFGTPGFQSNQPHHYYRQLSLKYGPIVSVWNGQTLQIILNSPEDIKELCDKRGSVYNDRPPMVFHDVIYSGMFIATCGYNEVWRKQRKLFASVAGRTQMKALLPVQYYETRQWLCDLIRDPENFLNHGERFGTSILTSTIYGFRAHDLAHPAARGLQLIGNWMENKMNLDRYPEDSWPILNKVPEVLATWRKGYGSDADLLRKIALAWWNPCKSRVARGINIPSVATDFVKTYQADGWSDDDAALVTMGLMMAGSGTTSATIAFFIMGCMTNPQAVRLAHEELDRVVGEKRLPTMEDEPNLPYIRAMIKENLRWRPISNHGMQHSTTKEDYYKGYRIPKGSIIIANAFTIHQDAEKYKDADSFEPARYLNYPHSAADAVNLGDPKERDHFAYGAGRRVCAGIHVAEVNLFIAISNLLWGFDIKKPVDKSGKVLAPNTLGYNGGFFGKPFEFKASSTPRSPERAAIMQEVFKNTETQHRSLADEANDGRMGDMAEVVRILEKDPDSYPAKE